MPALLLIATLLMALWSGYWFVGKSAVERGFAAFLQEAPARGIEVSQNSYAIAGFPNRFDLTVTAPRLTDQRSGISWQAPFVQVFSLSYKPWHVIAAFAPDQTVTTPREVISLGSEKLQSSVVVSPSSTLPLDRATLVGDSVKATSSLGWSFAADQLRFAIRLDPTRTNAYDLGLEMQGLIPDPALSARLPDLPSRISIARVNATATLSAPLDRLVAESRPALTAVSLREVILNWGDLTFFAKGDLIVSDGMPEGRIDIRVTGWRTMVALATGLGLITPEVAPTVLGMIAAFTANSADANVLEMPLVFADGWMTLGPLPLGPAPRLN